MAEKYVTRVSTYHEYLNEATAALHLGLKYPGLAGDLFCRYSLLLIANSLEAAANAMLLSLNLDKDYYDELEKLGTLLKFKTYCNFKGKKLDNGNVKIARIKDLISCRNEFVHPKPKQVLFNLNFDTNQVEFDLVKTKNRNYPLYFSEIKHNHTLTALEDVLSFVSSVCFDICELNVKDGSMMLGIGSCSSTGDIDILGHENQIKFDHRSFGH
jgi:hypothetical protein